MTAIAAIAEDGKVYMGGDSAGVGGLSLTVRKDTKVIYGLNKPIVKYICVCGQESNFDFDAPVPIRIG